MAEYRQVPKVDDDDDEEQGGVTIPSSSSSQPQPQRREPDGHYSSDGSDSEIDCLEDDDEAAGIEMHERDLTHMMETVQQHNNQKKQRWHSNDDEFYQPPKQPPTGSSSNGSWCACGGCRIVAILLTLTALVAAGWFLYDSYFQLPVHYSCPKAGLETDELSGFPAQQQQPDYFAPSTVRNETLFLQSYRNQGHDHWGISYKDYKKSLYEWKAQKFAPYLHSGDAIYESASGLGLNLVLTLEVVQEVANVTGLVVYGNDYEADSVKTANSLMDHGILPAGAQKGRICQADSSTQLHDFVPANAFDLVFTGYIPPLQDPLEFKLSNVDALWRKYAQICHPSNNRDQARKDQLQRLQEDWYAAWVSEMIRIAKPGAPVIVEQVSPSVCTDNEDWGGVDRQFWRAATVQKYRWDVDPKSIEIQEDLSLGSAKGEYESRYHVFMKKNVAAE